MTNYEKIERERQKVRYNNIKNAIWLLSNSFSKGKHKLSFSEKVSFNTIVDFYESNKKENLHNNELFAKMFIFVYSHLLKYYKATVFDDIPQKAIYSLLNKPITYHIDKLTEQLNDSEIYSYLEENNISFNHPATKTEEQKQEEIKNIDINKLTEKVFDNETVGEQLNLMINNYLTRL